MIFSKKLLQGILLKRYKRFFADIDYNGQQVTAHVPNTGSLKSCLFANQKCYFSESDNPNRKLKYTLEILETPTGLVGVNTQIPNMLVKQALEKGFLEHWKKFDIIKPEFKLSPETRIDFKLENSQSGENHFIEVKNVSLMEGGRALFPDAVTTRGQKHLKELMELKSQGFGAEIVFLIQREDVNCFQAARDIDPTYADLLKQAHQAGVIVTPIVCHLSSNEITLKKDLLPVEFV
ncbi:MAG: DNA/RNA nuclease SfsA [Bdellovibrionales bacterium]|nr:DNA/RNA nuclease SfsA [Bdellovibrionales bacterium]